MNTGITILRKVLRNSEHLHRGPLCYLELLLEQGSIILTYREVFESYLGAVSPLSPFLGLSLFCRTRHFSEVGEKVCGTTFGKWVVVMTKHGKHSEITEGCSSKNSLV